MPARIAGRVVPDVRRVLVAGLWPQRFGHSVLVTLQAIFRRFPPPPEHTARSRGTLGLLQIPSFP